MTSQHQNIASLQDVIWNGSVPLEIRLSPSECRIYDEADSYYVRIGEIRFQLWLRTRESDSISSAVVSSLPLTTTARLLHLLPDRSDRGAARRLVLLRGRTAEMALPTGTAL